MTAGEVIAKCKELGHTVFGDQTLLYLLRQCESFVYDIKQVCDITPDFAQTDGTGLLQLPEDISQFRVMGLVDENENDCPFTLTSKGIKCKNGRYKVVYKSQPPKVELDTELMGDEGYLELYFCYMQMVAKVLEGDIIGCNNYRSLFNSVFERLQRNASGPVHKVFKGGVV